MSKMQAFFAQNAVSKSTKEEAVSKRYADAEGNPLKWVFKAISPALDEKMKQDCSSKKMIREGKRKGQYETEFLAAKYTTLLTVNSITFPDLNDSALQESYGVFTAEEVLNQMLNLGELAEASRIAQEVNGFEVEFEDLVEEAKN